MIICDKLKKLFRKEEKSSQPNNFREVSIDYLGVSYMDIKKDSVVAHKKANDNIETLIKKLEKMSEEELVKERKAVMKSMNMKQYRSLVKFTENDIQLFIRGHLQSYIAEIEKELRKFK